MDFELVKNSALAVKALERVTDEKDFTHFLSAAKDLSSNIVELVQNATNNGMFEYANDLRDKVREAMTAAKAVLQKKTEEALLKFRQDLREVAQVLVQIMMDMKNERNRSSGQNVNI